MEAWIPIIGTLSGVLLGTASTYLVQSRIATQARDAAYLDAKRDSLSRFLAIAHQSYSAVVACYGNQWTEEGWSDTCRERLSELSADSLLGSLDGLRLLFDSETLAAAEELVQHLRHGSIVSGTVTRSTLRGWREDYWIAKHRTIANARVEMGVRRAVDVHHRWSLVDDKD